MVVKRRCAVSVLAVCLSVGVLAFGPCRKAQTAVKPPYTDYCKMLARDIAGKKHGFLAGNLLNYVGGYTGPEYNIRQHDTIGFTYPLFDDSRSRGLGIVTNETGTGHDMWSWDFYSYGDMEVVGTVIAGRAPAGSALTSGKRYENPAPKEMIWRPDRQVSRYVVGGVTIEEIKFISNNDVLCTIIKSSQPVMIEFVGHSYYMDREIPTFDGDPAGVPFMEKSRATAKYDRKNNCIGVVERADVMTKQNHNVGRKAVAGKFVYDGMSKVVGCSADIGKTISIKQQPTGQQVYKFTVPCDKKGLSLVFAMSDQYEDAVGRCKAILKNPGSALKAKTKFMNDLLNEQIPYFRCSDELVVKTYYYLWSLYFMYFRDVGKGFTPYPYTVTAIHNFRTLFSLDAYTYIQQAAWVADKEKWGYGNILNWQYMLPFKNGPQVPETFGAEWFSPIIGGNITHYPEASWMIYKHSGDKRFLHEVYTFFRNLYWQEGQREWKAPSDSAFFEWGMGLNICDFLSKMAKELGLDYDVAHWQGLKKKLIPVFRGMWQQSEPNLMGQKKMKDIPALWTMMAYEMPDEWAQKMTDNWVMNSKDGFLGEVPVNIRAKDSEQVWPFNVSTVTSWLAIEGMFRHHVDSAAIYCTLGHINGMVRDYGFPITPEAWDGKYKPWGSEYYGWDEAMVLPLIERIAGVDYSLIDDSFSVCEHLPESWDYVEIIVPIVKDGKTTWTAAKTSRKQSGGKVEKQVIVKGNRQGRLIIQPWLEERELLSSGTAAKCTSARGRAGYLFENVRDTSVKIELGKRCAGAKVYLWRLQKTQ